MKRHDAAWYRFLCACALILVAGCGFDPTRPVDQMREINPEAVAPLEITGVGEVPAETCGPGGALGDLIPECPTQEVCFSPACLNHDICYATCDNSQQQCDLDFFWDMVYLCDAADVDQGVRSSCYASAWIYYQAVAMFGRTFYDETQRIVCAYPDLQLTKEDFFERASGPAPSEPPFVDADADWLPDAWELSVMLDPTDPDDAWMDHDGDGLVNVAEYLRKSDPFVASAP